MRIIIDKVNNKRLLIVRDAQFLHYVASHPEVEFPNDYKYLYDDNYTEQNEDN